jgi:FHS family L-fucose permease-like MFS transporter
MSIIGGAVLSASMGFVSDMSSIHVAIIVPLLSFGVIAAFAWACSSQDRVAASNVHVVN